MAEETKPTSSAEVVAEVVVVSDVPEAEQVEKKSSDNNVTTTKDEVEKEKPTAEEEKISQSASFKEETNVAGELPDPEKKALDELKQLVHQALINHEFTTPVKEVTPPPPPPVVETKEIEKEEEKEKPIETKEKEEEKEKEKEKEKPSVSETEKKVEEEKKPVEAPCEPAVVAVVAEVVSKTTAVDEDGTKTVEAIAETIVSVVAPPTEEECDKSANIAEAEVTAPPPPPEEVSIWGIPLLADDRSDTILLKFLRARDFKVANAFAMLKSVVAWRKEFGIESLLDEDLGSEQETVVYMHGFDKEGHPVCYNAYGEFQNKELYHNTLADEEKRTKFLRWRIQFLERSIRKLDFSPDGICTIVQVNDLKNSPGPFKRELRLATNRALQLLQDNYPEFVAKQVFVNVPWWYLAFYKMINPFFTQRTKSKFVFAGPSKTAETLFKYISPEQVPVQYGGLSREGEHEFTTTDAVTEEIIKPATKHTIEFPITETCQLVWEVRVVGGEVSYGAEFVPEAEGGYTVIVQKSRKIAPSDEPVICDTFKTGDLGKVVLTFDNQTSRKKKLLYRSKTKPSE